MFDSLGYFLFSVSFSLCFLLNFLSCSFLLFPSLFPFVFYSLSFLSPSFSLRHTLSLTQSLCFSLSLTHSHTHSLIHSFSLTHICTLPHSLSFSRLSLSLSRVDFINVLHTAFTPVAPQSVRAQSSCQYIFMLLGATRVKAVSRTLMKLTLCLPWSTVPLIFCVLLCRKRRIKLVSWCCMWPSLCNDKYIKRQF